MARALLLAAVTVSAILALVIGTVYGLVGGGPGGEGVLRDGVREITLRGYTWGFSPGVLRVSPGESVRFVIESEDMHHGFAINELGLNLQLGPGRSARSPVVKVDLPEGVYAVHCSVFCGLGHASMKARLVVGAPPPPPGRVAPWLASAAAVAVAAGVWGMAWTRRGGRA
jgi:heme/copper-type cytochrome/quinol oxidase subunit 2